MPIAHTASSDLDYLDVGAIDDEGCGCDRCVDRCPCCDEQLAADVGPDACALESASERRASEIIWQGTSSDSDFSVTLPF